MDMKMMANVARMQSLFITELVVGLVHVIVVKLLVDHEK